MMNLSALYGGSPQEKARIRIVYALLGTAFFIPLHLYVMEVFFAAACILAVLYCLRYGVPQCGAMPLMVPAALFAAAALVSLAGSPRALFGAAFYMFTVFQYILLYIGVILFVRGEGERRLFVCVIMEGAAVVALYGLYQYVHMLTLQESEWVDSSAFPLLQRRMYSTLYNPNLLSAYLLTVMGVTASVSLWVRKKVYKAAGLGFFCLLALCLLLTYSRGAWISAAVMAFLLGLIWNRRIWVVFLAIPAVLLFYHGGIADRLISIFSHREADTSVAMRLDMWSDTVEMWLDHPFFGIGWGSFKFAYPAYNELIQKAGITIFHCHNLFLNILTETGLAGFITFFTFFFGHFHYGRLQLLKACRESFSYMLAAAVICVVAAISVSGLSDDDLFSTQVSMIFWLISALFCNDYAENAQGRENGLRNYSH